MREHDWNISCLAWCKTMFLPMTRALTGAEASRPRSVTGCRVGGGVSPSARGRQKRVKGASCWKLHLHLRGLKRKEIIQAAGQQVQKGHTQQLCKRRPAHYIPAISRRHQGTQHIVNLNCLERSRRRVHLAEPPGRESASAV